MTSPAWRSWRPRATPASPASWPAASPNVLSVGGTDLALDASNDWSSEVGWSGSGGGPSAYESQPSYQNGVVTQTKTERATPDVAYDANPSTGVAIYDSVPDYYEGKTYVDWVQVGGTSVGAPNWSALLAIADQGRALSGQPALNSTSPQQVMSILYDNPADFHDITSGTSTGTPNYSAGPGYNYVTGLGSPMASQIVDSLVGTSTGSVAPAASASTSYQSSHFLISAPATTPAWPVRYSAGPRGTTPAVVGSLLYHRPIPQAATLASWLKKSFLASGSI